MDKIYGKSMYLSDLSEGDGKNGEPVMMDIDYDHKAFHTPTSGVYYWYVRKMKPGNIVSIYVSRKAEMSKIVWTTEESEPIGTLTGTCESDTACWTDEDGSNPSKSEKFWVFHDAKRKDRLPTSSLGLWLKPLNFRELFLQNISGANELWKGAENYYIKYHQIDTGVRLVRSMDLFLRRAALPYEIVRKMPYWVLVKVVQTIRSKLHRKTFLFFVMFLFFSVNCVIDCIFAMQYLLLDEAPWRVGI